jgi:predicted phage terminase large subunit-like protein
MARALIACHRRDCMNIARSLFAKDDVRGLSPADLAAFGARKRWLEQARTPDRKGKQIPPDDPDWLILMFLCGRGFGKTVAETQWLWWEMWRFPNLVGHIVAPTLSDVRGTSFEGPAGLCQIIPTDCLFKGTLDKAYNRSTHELRLANGSLIRGFGAVEEASRLRGPQCHALVGDELREWDRPAGNLETAMSNALFGLRLPYPDGTLARAVFGTTPKPIPYLKRLVKRDGMRLVTGTSYENLANLSPSFRSQLLSMAGTALGRQEVEGLFLDEESDRTIIRRNWIKLWPHAKKLPVFNFIIESYDTASSEHNFDRKKQTTDPTGCAIFGVFNVADNFTQEERKKLALGRGRYAALLLDCWDERLGLPELLEKARTQHQIKWGTPGRRSDVVLIEDKSSGPGLRQFLAEYQVPCFPYNPGRQDKTMRLHAISPLIKQGCLFVPESARPDMAGQPRDWVEPFLEQLCAFAGPGTVEHDEYVDVTSSAIAYLHDRHILEAPPQERHVDFEQKLAEDREEALVIQARAKRRTAGSWYGS